MIKRIDLKSNTILISGVNSRIVTLIDKEIPNDPEMIAYLTEPKDPSLHVINPSKHIVICLHPSSKCNLSCEYCFAKSRELPDLTFDEVTRFILYIVQTHRDAMKFTIDYSGSGEPLLQLDKIIKIKRFCDDLSNKINKVFIHSFATNGVLLSEKITHKIQSNGILFGVSLDNDGFMQNDKRTGDISLHNRIIQNIKNIENREYIGVAVTLTTSNLDQVRLIKSLITLFPTISIKPVRTNSEYGINEMSIKNFKLSYSKFSNFIYKRTLKRDLKYIYAILNGDDYFGKFLYKVIVNEGSFTRCDAGFGRYSLSYDRNIYVCPSGSFDETFRIGNLEEGINERKKENFSKELLNRTDCDGCFAHYYCGGWCHVNSKITINDPSEPNNYECELNRHILTEVIKIAFSLMLYKPEIYSMVHKFALTRKDRVAVDEELSKKYQKLKPNLSFLEFKYLRDTKPKEFELLIKEGINQ